LENGQLSTVTKALKVLQAFKYEEPVLGVSELARRLGMGKSSVHRILTTLLQEGFVAKTVDDRYRLGLRVHELGQVAVHSLRLREVAHQYLERLRNESGETVHLAVLDGTEVVYVDRFESQNTLRLFSRLGHRTDAHTTSTGKCLLAFGPQEQVDLVLASGLPRRAPRTIGSKAALLGALETVRELGFAANVDENEPGVSSVGAPIFGFDGKCIAAVSIAGPSARMNADNMPKYARMARRSASEISTALGHRGPRSGERRAVPTPAIPPISPTASRRAASGA
jgi:IclR family transcriptional regulator, KDG regulon repressor